ncbi:MULTISPECIES: peptidase domain-containing ABC transporter [unclassified Chryseobacterium]|uniref:peptidase domain-containing ABC transporter n=1 Tax=unclassified Chryseobacterium TaxID=2593645 RepID=UPI000F44879A|nr:peptidase domain-containing ABC transporter [Chryseobacterium sp. G0240]ROI03701.1 peptidase domain-containing ABC transporter [Chryseobacterium sp. G0240]
MSNKVKSIFFSKFPFVPQKDQMDCGIACISMICKYYEKEFGYTYLKELSAVSREGVSMLNISDTFHELGIDNAVVKTDLTSLIHESMLPCVLHWNEKHFVVLYKIGRNIFNKRRTFYIADPAHGLIRLNETTFKKSWASNGTGFTLYTEPTEEFYTNDNNLEEINSKHLLKYVQSFRWELFKIFITLILGSVFTLAFPFLTEKLVDKGINNKDLNFILLILIAQLSLFVGQTIIEIIRSRISIYLGSRININIISDFLGKLMTMPLQFFDSKQVGDIIQRIYDHKRIENFLTSQSILTLFSMINFCVFFFVLAYYNWKILLYYVFITGLSILWILYFQSQRKIVDYEKFNLNSENQENTLELITGMQEIKLNSFEDYKKNRWKDTQEKLFKINFKVLNIDQIQLSGYECINNLKNIIVTYIVAQNVVSGHLTLGSMLSISYIIGEMNSPISHLVSFFRSLQDAKLSFSRINEINNYQGTEAPSAGFTEDEAIHSDIKIENLSFQYETKNSTYILKNINLLIPRNKTTAIVGVSGSGKTTLMKLLLKFYTPNLGSISIGETNLNDHIFENWIKKCGVVMQDGFIFSDTIERNIVTNDLHINYQKLDEILTITNIKGFADELPLGLKTKIGASGNGISGGQKQRILIARALYKNPHYLFFDEATSALDADNERHIHKNLQAFLKGKTAVIIAHRLSTVKNADKIIVLHKGRIVEEGNHTELVALKGEYFRLVKNQLELGN